MNTNPTEPGINHVNNEPAISMAEQLKLMMLEAKTKGKKLMINGIRYSFAGYPSVICDQYILFPPGSAEIGETGKLGSEAKNDCEKNPYPVLIAMQSVCGAEWILTNVCDHEHPEK